jgi:hypothetical protein
MLWSTGDQSGNAMGKQLVMMDEWSRWREEEKGEEKEKESCGEWVYLCAFNQRQVLL